MTAWVLPDHIADVLPQEARRIEELRRTLLDTARSYGYELVMPPLLEHLDSLLTGTGEALDLQTFKLVDQLSGRTLGLRADTTPQAARIDAHLLNRRGVARLCYSGPVVHTRPDKPHATREPLQMGCELFGHPGIEADLEVQQLAIDALTAAKVGGLTLDLADAGLVRALLSGAEASSERLAAIHAALAIKDAPELTQLTRSFDAATRQGLLALVRLYGDEKVLLEAEKAGLSNIHGKSSLHNLQQLSNGLKALFPDLTVSFDLADARGYGYYSGVRFAIYAQNAGDALVRGGRYDEVGAVFGRNRAAVGFSLDLKELAEAAPKSARRLAIRTEWAAGDAWASAVRRLRAAGETVVCVLPGQRAAHHTELQEFECDRSLTEVGGQWILESALPLP